MMVTLFEIEFESIKALNKYLRGLRQVFTLELRLVNESINLSKVQDQTLFPRSASGSRKRINDARRGRNFFDKVR